MDEPGTRSIQFCDKSIAQPASVHRLDWVTDRKIAGGGITGNVSITRIVQRDRPSSINARIPAKVGRINQCGTVWIELGNESIEAAFDLKGSRCDGEALIRRCKWTVGRFG